MLGGARRGVGMALAGVVLVALLAGCGSEPIEQWPPVEVYSVRGEVASLPASGRPTLGIRHEAIPEFVGITGEVEPMAPMTMQFAVVDGVDLAAIAIGSKIAFELEVDWSADERARVIALTALPPETELDFGAGG